MLEDYSTFLLSEEIDIQIGWAIDQKKGTWMCCWEPGARLARCCLLQGSHETLLAITWEQSPDCSEGSLKEFLGLGKLFLAQLSNSWRISKQPWGAQGRSKYTQCELNSSSDTLFNTEANHSMHRMWTAPLLDFQRASMKPRIDRQPDEQGTRSNYLHAQIPCMFPCACLFAKVLADELGEPFNELLEVHVAW